VAFQPRDQRLDRRFVAPLQGVRLAEEPRPGPLHAGGQVHFHLHSPLFRPVERLEREAEDDDLDDADHRDREKDVHLPLLPEARQG